MCLSVCTVLKKINHCKIDKQNKEKKYISIKLFLIVFSLFCNKCSQCVKIYIFIFQIVTPANSKIKQ